MSSPFSANPFGEMLVMMSGAWPDAYNCCRYAVEFWPTSFLIVTPGTCAVARAIAASQ